MKLDPENEAADAPVRTPAASNTTQELDITSSPVRKPFIPLWMVQAGFTPHQFRVLCQLWSHGPGRCYPGQETIAKCCRMELKTAKSAIKALVSMGYISREKRKSKGVRNAYEYFLNLPDGTRFTDGKTDQMAPGLNLPDGTRSKPTRWHPMNDTPWNESSGNDTPLLPAEDLPIEIPTKAKPATPKDKLTETIWEITPRMGRERSSKKQLRAALKKIPVASRPTEATMIHALEAWKRSEAWTKDGGQYVPGIHRWINEEQWENISEATSPKTRAADLPLDLGGRKPRAIRGIPTGPATGDASLPDFGQLETDIADTVRLYPKREKQAEAIEALAAHVRKGADLDAVAAGTRAIAAIIQRMPGGHLNTFVPSAAKFFQNRRWEDDPKTWLRGGVGKNGAPIPEIHQGGRRGTTIELIIPDNL